jgi:hypothetical protein
MNKRYWLFLIGLGTENFIGTRSAFRDYLKCSKNKWTGNGRSQFKWCETFCRSRTLKPEIQDCRVLSRREKVPRAFCNNSILSELGRLLANSLMNTKFDVDIWILIWSPPPFWFALEWSSHESRNFSLDNTDGLFWTERPLDHSDDHLPLGRPDKPLKSRG